MSELPRINIDQPRYDQSTFVNRVKHFFLVTNPLNILASPAKLDRAKRIVTNYRAGKPVPEVKTVDELWRAKYLYDSAFHPETGEKSIIIGRLSAAMPIKTFMTACMLTFYKTNSAVVFWQWFNQTYIACINYTNRSGASPISTKQIFASYVMATGGALSTALTLNRVTRNLNPLIGRFVPFVGVAAAYCINIPMMRVQELRKGLVLLDGENNEVGYSKKAAVIGISKVVLSRISMAAQYMGITPLVMDRLERAGVFKRYPRNLIQTLVCGFILIFATPIGCALFSQRASIKVDNLERNVRDSIKKQYPDISVVWFNKGL